MDKNKRRKIVLKILISLAVLFLLGAALLFAKQWQEGEQAEQNAQDILEDWQNAENSEEEQNDTMEGYSVIAELDIDSLDLSLPILSETTDEALKLSVCYYMGPNAGEDGNLVIVGHNYRNGALFGRIDELEVGDSVVIKLNNGSSYRYEIYKTEQIKADNAKALSATTYEKELTLLTCTSQGNERYLVRCKLAEETKSGDSN